MQKPDLHIVKPSPNVHAEHPRGKITREEEVLEPVGDSEVSRPIANTFLSLLSRLLAVGSVLAIVTLIFLNVLSVVFVTVDKPAPPSDVSTNELPPAELVQTDEPLTFHSFYEANLEPVTTIRSNVRRRRAKPRIHRGVRTVGSPVGRFRKPLVPLFMPTTLVIYIENGAIKTRIEPWVQTTRP